MKIKKLINKHRKRTFILTQKDIISDKIIPFSDINYSTFEMNKYNASDEVLYREYTNNPDIPYVDKVIKEAHNPMSVFDEINNNVW